MPETSPTVSAMEEPSGGNRVSECVITPLLPPRWSGSSRNHQGVPYIPIQVPPEGSSMIETIGGTPPVYSPSTEEEPSDTITVPRGALGPISL